MTTDKARHLQENWKAKKGNGLCLHGRMVDTLVSQGMANSQLLVCLECGAIIPDPVMKLGKNNVLKEARPILAFVS